jgi:uncharacterized phage protein (TIGR01671 family)
MNREIKFRGKSIMNNTCGDWLYSSGIKYGDDVELMYCDEDTSEEWNYIDKKTVGQYTGLHDKKGKEIYEGDIVKYRDSRGQHIEKVIFDKGCFYAGMHWGSSTRVAPKLINPRITEVIGNEVDNPELLGGK